MINIIAPPKSLRMGERVKVMAPSRAMQAVYLDFLKRNVDYHQPWVYHSADPQYFDHYLARIKRGVTQGCFIFDRNTGHLIGVVNLNNIMLGVIRSASLGYYAEEAYAGQGYMREGMMLVLDYAVEQLGLHRFEANIQPDNIPSIKLVEKLGFRKEGFSPKYLQIGGKWRDHERWAILDEEILQWRQNK
ncbi:GNAT family protein [Paremcibacter congregatus]|uniref:GNAT family N-acetyltransferase n=1 Tax=Paremcibacter congregatus TaxID=2043170 RepID=UPI0030EF22FD|tara:strand:- start:2093 stop:2659 length:567 start_codon:yes stop_codon:yes gene_type:complete